MDIGKYVDTSTRKRDPNTPAERERFIAEMAAKYGRPATPPKDGEGLAGAALYQSADPDQRKEWKRRALEHVAKGSPYPQVDSYDPSTWNLDSETRVGGAQPGVANSFEEEPSFKTFPDWVGP